MSFRFALAVLALSAFVAVPATAAPQRYLLEAEASQVSYAVTFGDGAITGTMPIGSAEVVLDFDRAANSAVSVTMDVGGTTANFPFAAQALRGPKVLNAAAHPEIRFVTREVRPQEGGARVSGEITIRGVTRPLVLDAQLYRQKGTEEGDRSRLTVYLTGALSRSAFGADGWAEEVGDEVNLNILARVRLAE